MLIISTSKAFCKNKCVAMWMPTYGLCKNKYYEAKGWRLIVDYFVNDGSEVPGERVLVDVLAEEVVLSSKHDLRRRPARDDVERVPEVDLR